MKAPEKPTEKEKEAMVIVQGMMRMNKRNYSEWWQKRIDGFAKSLMSQVEFTIADKRWIQDWAIDTSIFYEDEIFEDLKKMGRYKQNNGKWGFFFSYEDYVKLRKKYVPSIPRRKGEKYEYN